MELPSLVKIIFLLNNNQYYGFIVVIGGKGHLIIKKKSEVHPEFKKQQKKIFKYYLGLVMN